MGRDLHKIPKLTQNMTFQIYIKSKHKKKSLKRERVTHHNHAKAKFKWKTNKYQPWCYHITYLFDSQLFSRQERSKCLGKYRFLCGPNEVFYTIDITNMALSPVPDNVNFSCLKPVLFRNQNKKKLFIFYFVFVLFLMCALVFFIRVVVSMTWTCPFFHYIFFSEKKIERRYLFICTFLFNSIHKIIVVKNVCCPYSTQSYDQAIQPLLLMITKYSVTVNNL